MADSFARLRAEVVDCRRCPRLVEFRARMARDRAGASRPEAYWDRPVPGFGDPEARLALVGLAPSARGANRTGRPFTGDRSGEFLVRALYDAGFANRPTSTARADGLVYRDLYLTATVRCVPPDNRPTPAERSNCAPFLARELALLGRLQAILALGGFAWDAVREVAGRLYGTDPPRVPFAHGAFATLGPGRPQLFASYHPSPQNTQTGRLTSAMLVELLERIRGGFPDGARSARQR